MTFLYLQPFPAFRLTAPRRRATDVSPRVRWCAWCRCRQYRACAGWRRAPRSTTSRRQAALVVPAGAPGQRRLPSAGGVSSVWRLWIHRKAAFSWEQTRQKRIEWQCGIVVVALVTSLPLKKVWGGVQADHGSGLMRLSLALASPCFHPSPIASQDVAPWRNVTLWLCHNPPHSARRWRPNLLLSSLLFPPYPPSASLSLISSNYFAFSSFVCVRKTVVIDTQVLRVLFLPIFWLPVVMAWEWAISEVYIYSVRVQQGTSRKIPFSPWHRLIRLWYWEFACDKECLSNAHSRTLVTSSKEKDTDHP